MSQQEATRVRYVKGAINKKKLFEMLAEELSDPDGPSFHRVLDGLNAREKLGSTCIGKGVAIPHCKLAIDTPRATIMILDEGFKYADHCVPDVNIVFGLVVPSENCDQHLHLLSSIAKLCDSDSWLEGLKSKSSAQELINYLAETDSSLGEIL